MCVYVGPGMAIVGLSFKVLEFQKAPHTSIYKFCLSIRLYPINVKTAEPNGPKFLFFYFENSKKLFLFYKKCVLSKHLSLRIFVYAVLVSSCIYCYNQKWGIALPTLSSRFPAGALLNPEMYTEILRGGG